MSEIINRIRQYCKSSSVSAEKVKKIAILVALIPVAFIAFAANSNAGSDEPEITDDKDIPEIEESAADTIYVDIGGAVKTPMLAELPSGSRVEDAILAAGGLTDKADISSINRAEFLEDGEKIYIPELIEDEEMAANGVAAGDGAGNGSGYTGSGVSTDSSGTSGSAGYTGGSAGGKININTADSDTLQQLNGVGPATAQKIIDYRTSNGRFRTIEDIKNVSGIGDKTFEKLKDSITI